MRWVTEPPIKEVSNEDAKALFSQYEADMRSWIAKAQPGGRKPVRIDEKQKEWNADIESRIGMAEFYSQKGTKFVYQMASGPVAFMLLVKRSEDVRIENLSAHVGAAGAGPIMIEWAVNFSVEQGCNGKVSLFDASRKPGFYESLGFVGEEEELGVDPIRSDLWVLLGSKWKLKKYQSSGSFLQNLE